MECKHHRKEGEGYHYKLSSGEELWLCRDCNMILAGELMKQLAIEVFIK